jgi:hypothetical protein
VYVYVLAPAFDRTEQNLDTIPYSFVLLSAPMLMLLLSYCAQFLAPSLPKFMFFGTPRVTV